jgi:ABC-2 type transport system ATP-binding protein
MDEPTVGIDPQSRKPHPRDGPPLSTREGVTVFYTSHYMEEVEHLCSRIAIMDRGKIIAEGTSGGAQEYGRRFGLAWNVVLSDAPDSLAEEI